MGEHRVTVMGEKVIITENGVLFEVTLNDQNRLLYRAVTNTHSGGTWTTDPLTTMVSIAALHRMLSPYYKY